MVEEAVPQPSQTLLGRMESTILSDLPASITSNSGTVVEDILMRAGIERPAQVASSVANGETGSRGLETVEATLMEMKDEKNHLVAEFAVMFKGFALAKMESLATEMRSTLDTVLVAYTLLLEASANTT